MKRLVIVFPVLTSYILPVFRGMAESGRAKIDVLYSPEPQGLGFGGQAPFEHPNVRWIQVTDKRPFGERWGMYQGGLLAHLWRTRPDAVLIWANPRYLSFWGVLLLGKLLSIPVYPRGHGLVKQPNAGALKKWMYRLIVALSHAYICYTPKVRESLAFIQNDAKLPVDYNTLYNDFPVRPEEKTGKEKGIFFVGRVRDGCGVDVLISAIQTLREKDGLDVEAHIIGDGPWRAILEEKAAQFPHWLKYYGGVFDQKKITEISRTCRIGCGPGFMGLNVVHMLSLSLPVITHANLAEHMGPEPEYIQHGINGWLLKRKGDVKMLQNILGDVWNLDKTVLGEVRNNAYSSYKTLSIPPYHKRLLGILNA